MIIGKIFRSLLFVFLLSGLITIFAACTTGQPTPVPTATSIQATATPEGIQYPITVTDMMGRSVEITSKPQRIVGISPTAMEMLYEIGGVAVGRDSGSNFSDDVAALPAVGGAYNPSVEAIVTLQPDLIIIEALTQGHLTPMLASLKVPIVAVRATSVQDVANGLELLGKVTDLEQEARDAKEAIEERVNDSVSSVRKYGFDRIEKSVLILIADADHNFYAALQESYPGGIASMMNLTNVTDGMDQSGPYHGFTLFSPEQAATSNPDVILAISPAPEPAPRLSSMLPRVPGYSTLGAVTEGRTVEIDPDLFLQAPGPRIADAIEELETLLREMNVSEGK